jgi:hypothetical protein
MNSTEQNPPLMQNTKQKLPENKKTSETKRKTTPATGDPNPPLPPRRPFRPDRASGDNPGGDKGMWLSPLDQGIGRLGNKFTRIQIPQADSGCQGGQWDCWGLKEWQREQARAKRYRERRQAAQAMEETGFQQAVDEVMKEVALEREEEAALEREEPGLDVNNKTDVNNIADVNNVTDVNPNFGFKDPLSYEQGDPLEVGDIFTLTLTLSAGMMQRLEWRVIKANGKGSGNPRGELLRKGPWTLMKNAYFSMIMDISQITNPDEYDMGEVWEVLRE